MTSASLKDHEIQESAIYPMDSAQILASASAITPDLLEKDPKTTNAQDNSQASEQHPADTEDPQNKEELQHGVQAALASTQLWSVKQLVVLYILIWLAQFFSLFVNGVVTTLSPYVTSAFASHSLVSTSQIIASLCAGLVQLPYAKLLDIWGRGQGLAVMTICQTVGFIMLAACKDVKVYCAARVFFQTGYAGVIFSIIVIIADTSSLRHRALWIAVLSTPSLVTIWLFGPATSSIIQTIGWRWGMGIFAILTPVTCFPLCGFLFYYQQKSRKAHLIPEQNTDKSIARSLLAYAKESDLLGLLILTLGLALFILSFNLYTYQSEGWRSPMIICFIIFGGALIIAFIFYERFLAPVTFMPWSLITERTIIFAYAMDCFLLAAFYIWGTYFLSMLLIVWKQDLTHATYIFNIQAVGATISGLFVGAAAILGVRIKYIALFIAIPFLLLGAGLLYHFAVPSANLGYLIMTQIFISFGTGILLVSEQVVVMAVASQQRIPAVIATETLMASIGTAFGSAISGAIWSNVFPEKLTELLPPGDVHLVPQIYGSIFAQLSYPTGSPIKSAIDQASSSSLRYMLINSLCLYAAAMFCIACWKNVDLGKRGFLKGRL